MAIREKQANRKRNFIPNFLRKPDPRSLKDNPDGETVCSAYFSKGCINEDTDSPVLNQEGDENEKY